MFDGQGVGRISALGQRYLQGELRQQQLERGFELSRRGDIPELATLEATASQRLRGAGLDAVAGRVAFCVLAAGASSRMDLKRVPARVSQMLTDSGCPDMPASKALVPVAEHHGRVLNFLDVFLHNVAGFAPRATRDNPVVIFTSDSNSDEIEARLANHSAGVGSDRLIVFRQPLEPQLAATVADLERARKNFASEEDFASALAFSREFAGHELEFRKPAGHGEFLHQLIASGTLGDLIQRGVQYLFIRNIDNAAALLDDAWLTIFGHAVEHQLDAIIEVAQRLPGQKGGALIRSAGAWRIAEDPSFAGTGQEARDSFYINNAVAVMSVKYIASLYDTDGPELLQADGDELQRIADRGRSKFPTIVEAKPVNLHGRIVGAITPETNMWESTGVAAGMSIGAFGVYSEQDAGDDFLQVAPAEREKRARRVRFSPTKTWDDYNDPLKQAILASLAAYVLPDNLS